MMPLEGTTVVTLEQAVAGPFASRQLADLGARVIKVERPGVGDFARSYDTRVKGLSSYFVWTNRGKESLTLDLKHPRGQELLARLLERADVFLHNLAPGAVERLGFGAAALRERHPRLVVCEISGYGSTGPHRDRKAYDLLVQAEAGLVSVTGTRDEPCKVGISVADIAAAMYALTGVLTALLQRERSGEGARVEVSMFDALAEWMSHPAYYTGRDGEPPPRSGARHATIAPYGPFACGGDGQVFLGIQNEREWVRFCDRVLGRAELADDPRFQNNPARVAHREELQEIVEAVFRGRAADEVLKKLETEGIAGARASTVQDFLDHPQLAARERWRQIASPVGPLEALLPPVIMEGVEPAMGAIPDLGEHSSAILRELGLDEEAVQELQRQSVI